MKDLEKYSRRKVIGTGVAGLLGLMLPSCSEPGPPTYGHILRMGDALTYHAQQLLLPEMKLAKEFSRSDISSFPAIGSTSVDSFPDRTKVDEYFDLQKEDFRNYAVSVEGLVANPMVISISEIRKMHKRIQITRHMCEEGWTAIAEWTGTPLRLILEKAGIKENAKYVWFYSYDGWYDSINMIDALHPQTLLAYGMNGKELPIRHGGPLRLRVETQLGFKSLKFVHKIVVSDEVLDGGGPFGWQWHGGI